MLQFYGPADIFNSHTNCHPADAYFQYPDMLFHIIKKKSCENSDFTMLSGPENWNKQLAVAYKAVPRAYQMLRSFPETAFITFVWPTHIKELCLSTQFAFSDISEF